MRIAYLSDSAIPSNAANSVQVMRMCAAMSAEGNAVCLCARRASHVVSQGVFSYYGIKLPFRLHRLWYPQNMPGRSRFYALQAALRAFLWRPDFAFCRCPYAAIAACRLGIPTIFEAHSVPFVGSRRDRKILPTLFAQRNLIGVVAITHALADDLTHRYELPQELVLVAADGADIPPTNVKAIDLKRPGRLCVGYVGHLYPGKGMEIVIPLAKQCPEMDFHVVGGTDDLVASWRAKAAGLPNLTFHGFVPPDQTGRYIMACDVLLGPLQKRVSAVGGEDIGAWTSPLKIFEYMSHGRAIIASDIPVLREVLTPNHNCLLAPPDDVAKWRRALLQLEGSPDLRRSLGSQAQMDFEGNYTWNQRARKIMTFVRSRLQPGRAVTR